MSALIKGMEMPKCCADCPIEHHEEDYYGDEFSHECGFFYKGYTREVRKNGRLKKCPLIEVPDHGRLIDASELVTVQLYDEEHEEWPQVAMTIDYLLCQGWVEAEAKTVIPASEKEAANNG